MMKVILEYQEKMAAGGDHMGASVGMMRMWSGNKTAKYLMPLLSKEKKRFAMEKVEQEAQAKGIEVPSILTDLDEKTGNIGPNNDDKCLGMPKLFNLEQKEDDEEPPVELEQMVQKQIEAEEANEIPVIIVHEVECQTEMVETSDKIEQTVDKVVEDEACQAEEEKVSCQEMETQTETVEGCNVEAQTNSVETVDEEVITIVPPTLEDSCQTESSPTMDQISQTNQADLVDADTNTELEVKHVRIQTPSPQITQKTIQTEDLEVSEEENAQEEEDVSEESLHWDPVDGLHAEKQLPVAMLAEMFDRNITPERGKRQ
ncbi:hypothetical protein OESDEN_09284 [Oesophagostomum dentatum]|uniref:Uncharacterized protein n=1 Tax=Oesophagostomum dentatum TaxID=61180 RepID=A0A0B1T3X6_OESDE|nr:hypothetical protein OESDEN_09284 [Oesophagostomum dentatum]